MLNVNVSQCKKYWYFDQIEQNFYMVHHPFDNSCLHFEWYLIRLNYAVKILKSIK